MRSLSLFLVAMLGASLALCGAAHAQDLEETLSDVSGQYASAYVAPLVDGLGATFNSGFIRDVPLARKGNGFGLYLGLQAFGAFLPDDRATFDLTYEADMMLEASVGGNRIPVRVPVTLELRGAPTIVGPEEPAVATVTARYDTTISRYGILVPVAFDTTFTKELVGGLLATNVVPTVVPQLRIGRLFGTDLVVRWLPRIEASDLGSLGLFGLGFRYDLSQFLPAFPVGLAAQAFWQRVTVNDAEDVQLLDFRTFAAGVNVGRRFGPLSVYAGLQTERTSMDVSYEFDVESGGSDPDFPELETIPIAFSLEGAMRGRATVGAALHAGPTVLNFDYSLGEIPVVVVGLGLAF